MEKKKINEFLKYLAKLYQENEIVESGHDFVYSLLTRIGIKESEKSLDISSVFDHWIESFKDTPNINVFVDAEENSYFCQFTNSTNTLSTYYKLFVPLDSKRIVEGAKQIFNFMAQNNIRHSSKIGAMFRNDVIVIRVSGEQDLNKVIDYLKSNKYIKKGLIEPNPFMNNYDGFGVETDGTWTYSGEVASYLTAYMEDKKKLNDLKKVNYDDLFKYIIDTYNSVFVLKDEASVKRFEKIREHDKLTSKDKIGRMVESLLTSCLIIEQLGGGKFETVQKYYNNFLDPNYMAQARDSVISIYQNPDFDKTEELIPPINYITNAAKETILKYGYDQARSAFDYLYKTGDYTGFTDTNNVRSILEEKLTVDQIKELVGPNVDSYMLETLTSLKQDILLEASKSTLSKHGEQQLLAALKTALEGNYEYFTNQAGGRDMLTKMLSKEDVSALLSSFRTEGKDDILAYADYVSEGIKK